MSTTAGRVADKVIYVTGARGDLGTATVQLLVDNGATVVSFDRAGAPSAIHHERVIDIDVDVTVEADVAAAVARATAEVGAPDVLVNAAGIIGRPAPSYQATVDEFDAIFDVNVKGVWLMTKHCVPAMIEAKRGSIINFSSIHGLTGGKNVPLYHATKGAVRLLTKADAAAYGEFGVRVNSIHPGSMKTRMSRTAAELSPMSEEDYYKQLVGGNPLPHQGDPIDIAYGVLFLASDESKFSTGSELVIDGGYTAV